MISVIRKFAEIVVYGNVWISLGATALSLNTFLLLGWEQNYTLLLLVFFATLLSYTFQRVIRHKGSSSINSARHLWVYNHQKALYILIIIYAGISGYLFFCLFKIIDLLYFSPLVVTALFYAVKISKKSLRDVAYIKIILISMSWAAVTVLIPAHLNKVVFSPGVWWVFALNFVYIFALVIPFDIRDLVFDESDKNTIPQLLGIKRSKILAVLLISICGVLGLWFFEAGIALLPVYCLSIVLILFTNKNQPELFYTIGIDGLLLLFPISTWIINLYF